VNEEELKTPAISINYCKLIFIYPLKNDFKLRVDPKGEPGGSVILTFSKEEMLNGKYDWAYANVIVGIGIVIEDKFNEFPKIDWMSIDKESLFNTIPSFFATSENIY
jgi:hypothetical protein